MIPAIVLLPIGGWYLMWIGFVVYFAIKKHRSAFLWGGCSVLLSLFGIATIISPILVVMPILLVVLSFLPFLCPTCQVRLTNKQHEDRECPHCRMRRRVASPDRGDPEDPPPATGHPWTLSKSRAAMALSPALIGYLMITGLPTIAILQRIWTPAVVDTGRAVRPTEEPRTEGPDQGRQAIADESIRLSLRVAEIAEIRKDRELTDEESAALAAEEKEALDKLPDLQKRLEEMDSPSTGQEAGQAR